MDLLGSILGSMEKPPSASNEEKKKAQEQRKLIEKRQEREKQKLIQFREKMQKDIHSFIKDSTRQKYKFKPMDKVLRAIVHEVADVAGLTSFSFGLEEEERYVMLWKKEFAPADDELSAYKRGEDWDPEKAKADAKLKELEELAESSRLKRKHSEPDPASNYRLKYKHLIGDEAAKDAARSTTANKSYGFVPSENKKDQRTIEQVLADTRARKKLIKDGAISGDVQGQGHTPQADSSASENTAL